MLTQDDELVKKAAKGMGIDSYKMFATILADRNYDDMMDEDKQVNLKERMEVQTSFEKTTERA